MTVVVGTAGHIDHGKTTLLRALTGIDADRLPEERRRGMTIDVGYAHLAFADGSRLDFVDVPGHDRLIGNMLVGAGEIDAALLVVAADDGPRAQTREHLALLDALDIRHGLAVVTKADIAGQTQTKIVVSEVERLLEGTSLAGSPILPVSSLDGTGIEAVRSALALLIDRVQRQARSEIPRFGSRLAIDRLFAIKGRGVVVTGTLRGRGLAVGGNLRLVPGDQSVRIREIQVHNQTLDRAEPGRTALNLAGVNVADLHRGLVLTDDPAVTPSDRSLVVMSRSVPDRSRARLHLGTEAVDVSIGRSGRDAIDLVDGRAVGIVRLARPIAMAIGDRFVLRRGSGEERIVGGVILDDRPPKGISRRRQTVEHVGSLATAIGSGDPEAIHDARLDLHGFFVPRTGRPRVAPDVMETVARAVIGAVTDGPTTLTASRSLAAKTLRQTVSVGRTEATLAGARVVDALLRDGRLVRETAQVRLPGPPVGPSPAADPALAVAMDRLEALLDIAAPPALGGAARTSGCPAEGIRALELAGRIIVLEPDLAYAAPAYRELTGKAVAMASVEPLTPAAFRDATGTSRKYVLAIFADLDRRGILRRTPDGHLPGPRPGAAIDSQR